MNKLRFSLALVVVAGALLVAATAASAAPLTGISGRVTDSLSLAPVENVSVCAYNVSPEVEPGCATTDANGEYVIPNLEAGTYKVEFNGEFILGAGGPYFVQWYSGKPSFETAEPVTVVEGSVTPNINAAIQGRGRITGTVTDAGNGAPIGGIEVCVSANGGQFQFFFNCTKTNAGGQYRTEGLQAGSYKVEFRSPSKYNGTLEKTELEGPNYVTQYYSGQARPETAAPVAVSDGTVSGGINAAMQAGATISGTVTDAVTNAALQGVDVCAWGASNFECTLTDTAGNYSIPTLAAGSYKVEFAPERLFNKALFKEGKPAWQRGELPLVDYAVQYWNEKASFEAAETVTATATQTTSGINGKLIKEVQPPPPPPPAPAHGIGIVGAKAKVKGSKALLQVRCKGAGACKGTVKLAARVVRVTKGRGNRPTKRAHIATIGHGSFSIPAGQAKVVPVNLNGAGKVLVTQAGGKGLKAKVSGQGVKTGSVTLKGKAKPRPKPKQRAPRPKKNHKG